MALFPLLLIGFAALVLLIDGAQRAAACRCAVPRYAGWAFGFGHFLAGLYWVAYAFLVDPGRMNGRFRLCWCCFPAGWRCFRRFACAAAACAMAQGSGAHLSSSRLAYAIAEYLRGHILTGFPWNLPAYGWGASLGVLQSASVFGAYGLSLLTILFGASLAMLGRPQAAAWCCRPR